MNVAQIIQHIRKHAPIFQNRVAGAAQYEAIDSIANLPMPAAYVIPLSDDATPNEHRTGIFQTVTETFAVVVVLDNTVDQRGQATSSAVYHDVRAALWKALLGWEMPGSNTPTCVEYVGAHLLMMDRARAQYRFVFAVPIIIDQHDGYVPDSTDLLGAEIDTGLIPAHFEIDLSDDGGP